MSYDAALPAFLTESLELLEKMEMSLVELAQTGSSPELINDVFRAAHTIKGSGGVFGFDHVVEFTHVVENLLDNIRAGKQEITTDMPSLLLECCDHMRVLVQQAVDGTPLSADEQQDHQQLLERLQDCLEPTTDEAKLPVAKGSSRPDPRILREETDPQDPQVSSDHWHISVRFSSPVLQYGMDPLSFLRYLNRLGQVIDVVTVFDDQVQLETLDPELCYLGYEILFQGDVDRKELEEVFEFVREDCTLHILPPVAYISQYVDLIKALPEEDLKLGEILVRVGALTAAELEQALHWQNHASKAANQPPRLGEVLVEAGSVHEEVVQAAASKQASVRKSLAERQKSLRVDAEKLDQLVNLIGELVIAAASSKLLANESGAGSLMESISIVERLVEDIRDAALGLRMVQIGETFNRFQRVVLDVSRELGKDVRLEISGGDAELDKTLVERVRDPLMHLVRNGIDHGLEDPETRIAQGKPAQGCIRLNAFHDSGSIIIEVQDDGRGLQREAIRRKAIEKGLIQEEDELSDREVYRLIFEPGFSTAAQVTNLSGRGVGMDVVKREVEALRGSIDIDSAPGQGTKISIRLPLTLAIINGFLFRVGNAHYVVPLELVGECIEAPRLDGRHETYMNLRGAALPLLRLAHLFQLETQGQQRENVIVIESAGMRAGLVVNELLGEFQTVIKPLGKMFAELKGIAGSTILGSGEVAIVLDPYELLQAHVLTSQQASGAQALMAGKG